MRKLKINQRRQNALSILKYFIQIFDVILESYEKKSLNPKIYVERPGVFECSISRNLKSKFQCVILLQNKKFYDESVSILRDAFELMVQLAFYCSNVDKNEIASDWFLHGVFEDINWQHKRYNSITDKGLDEFEKKEKMMREKYGNELVNEALERFEIGKKSEWFRNYAPSKSELYQKVVEQDEFNLGYHFYYSKMSKISHGNPFETLIDHDFLGTIAVVNLLPKVLNHFETVNELDFSPQIKEIEKISKKDFL